MIPFPIMPQFHFLFRVPLVILKFDLPVFRNSGMNRIDRIIDAFIHRFDPAGYINLTLQLLGIIFAYQFLELFAQLRSVRNSTRKHTS